MPISPRYMFLMARDANRRRYEEDIANGKGTRLNPELEQLLFGFQNDMTLSLGGQIPLAEINAKAKELADQAGVTTEEFKEVFLDSQATNLLRDSP